VPDIVIAEFMNRPSVDDLARDYAVLYDPELVDRRAALLGALGRTRALIVRNRTQVDAALLDAAPALVVVGRLGVGLDNIDVEACRARGVNVVPATGANDVSVAEYVIAGILMLRRGAYFATDAVRAGDWPRQALIGREAAGATLGLIGFGAIARRVARRARALGMGLVAHDPYVPDNEPAWGELQVARRSLEDLLAESDAISLHVPATPETRGLIGPAAIARMKPGSVLINAARGGLVDEPALAEALKEGRLAGAMIDVFAEEPLGADNAFAGVPNLILTPHVAGVTAESNARVGAAIATGVRRVLESDTAGRAGRPSGTGR